MWEELLRKLKEKEKGKEYPLQKELELPIYEPVYDEPKNKDEQETGERGVVVIEL